MPEPSVPDSDDLDKRVDALRDAVPTIVSTDTHLSIKSIKQSWEEYKSRLER